MTRRSFFEGGGARGRASAGEAGSSCAPSAVGKATPHGARRRSRVSRLRRCSAARDVRVCGAARRLRCVRRERRGGQLRIGMVTDVGGLGDRSFNDSAYGGLQRAKKELHVEMTVLQSRSAADYQANMTVLANKEYDEIFAIGFLMARTSRRLRSAIPSATSRSSMQWCPSPTSTSVTFNEEEGSFLAGARPRWRPRRRPSRFWAASTSRCCASSRPASPPARARSTRRSRSLVKYVGWFDDVAAGKELAGVLFDQGADIVYVAAGKAGLGAIDQVKAPPRRLRDRCRLQPGRARARQDPDQHDQAGRRRRVPGQRRRPRRTSRAAATSYSASKRAGSG